MNIIHEQKIIIFYEDRYVYHTTGEKAGLEIIKNGFKTGNELKKAERRHAIYFSDLTVNPNIYARNKEGETYSGQKPLYIRINIKYIPLLNISYKHNGIYINYKKYSSFVVRGELQNISEIIDGEAKGTINFLENGDIFEVCLPKNLANELLKSS